MMTRREFTKSASLTAAAAAAPMFIPAATLGRSGRVGPSAKIGVGFIGMGKRAFELLGPFMQHEACRVLAVCDVDTTRRERGKADVDKHYGDRSCQAFNDYRELLAMPGIDAVAIMTPDHWHVNQVLDSAAAKKDIYCEKPLTLCLREGQLMIDAVRKHGVVFQTGSQQRTEYEHRFVRACELVRNEKIGALLTVHVGVPTSSKPCDLGEEAMEPGLDWDRWLGPAPKRPYHSVLSPRGVHGHYPKWREYKEYSGGGMTDFGAHNFDIAHWGMGMDASGPVEVVPPKDPSAMYGAKLVYANGVEVLHGGPFGTTFTGTKGQVHVFRDYLVTIPEKILKDAPSASDLRLPRHVNHHSNWFDCIRSREKPVCDVEVGARSIACAHLCNLAYWHRRRLKWDPAAWEFPGDAEANAWRDYARREGYGVPTV